MKTFEDEVKDFINGLPYWGRFLCGEILAGNAISDDDINIAHTYLLEDLGLKEKAKNPDIEIDVLSKQTGEYKCDLFLTELVNIEGINALAENQHLKFNKNMTIIYGANGSGKSGYVRLFKKAFYSKSEEDILPNIYKDGGKKKISADFVFKSEGLDTSLTFPTNKENEVFNQFAVFDGKSVLKHLDERNNFEFRPAALTLFADFNAILNKLKSKHESVVQTKNTFNNYAEIFEGESEIKTFIDSISVCSKLDILKKHIPYSEVDRKKKQELQKEHDDLKLSLGSKGKKIKELKKIKSELTSKKTTLEKINKHFNSESLVAIYEAIIDCNEKQETAKKEGVEKFKTDKIKYASGDEWAVFIKAAEKYALKQKEDGSFYPDIGDNCLLCHQSINKEQKELILSYWAFIESVAEQDAKNSELVLTNHKETFSGFFFDQFLDNNVLTIWMTDNYPEKLKTFQDTLDKQQLLSIDIVKDLDSRATTKMTEVLIDLTPFDAISAEVDDTLKRLEEGSGGSALDELVKKICYLTHKEKLQQHYDNIEILHQDIIWVSKANKANWQSYKTNSTKTEKRLSTKYFNQQYIDFFNSECTNLNGDFGIDIDSKSADATSNRKLSIKGKTPSAVLSEGEQKVIALADFFSETHISNINKGIIFDDPVNSLDEARKSQIANSLVAKSEEKQVIVFTHDLIFVSMLITANKDSDSNFDCHWIEKREDTTGHIWLNNSPSYEKEYRSSFIPGKHYSVAKNLETSPTQRESEIKAGFTALRTCYEVLVINDLFKNVVMRFSERVSVDSLSRVNFNKELVNELLDSFGTCCRYMEGHTHSDKYAFKKPECGDLNCEIQRYDALRSKIKKHK